MDSISCSGVAEKASSLADHGVGTAGDALVVRVGVGADQRERVLLPDAELRHDHPGRLVHLRTLGPRAVAGLLLGGPVRQQAGGEHLGHGDRRVEVELVAGGPLVHRQHADDTVALADRHRVDDHGGQIGQGARLQEGPPRIGPVVGGQGSSRA